MDGWGVPNHEPRSTNHFGRPELSDCFFVFTILDHFWAPLGVTQICKNEHLAILIPYDFMIIYDYKKNKIKPAWLGWVKMGEKYTKRP